MNKNKPAPTPASHRALELMCQHHGLPTGASAGSFEKGVSDRIWTKETRRRHLHARRRVIRLDEIPESQYPVILELHGGSNFVILLAKPNEETYSVQFPDSRRSDVSAERLEEFYDGRCIFLKPRRKAQDAGGGGGVVTLRSRFLEMMGSARLSRGAFGFNLVVLLLTLLLVYSNELALGAIAHRSLLLPLLSTGFAALALAGLIGLRHEFFRQRSSGGWVDLAFVPVLFAASIMFAGWFVVPVIGFGAALLVYLLGSKRLGTVPSRIQRHWKMLVSIAFLIGAATLSIDYMSGGLNAAMMNGTLGLSTYAIYLIAHGGTSWQSMRLALWS